MTGDQCKVVSKSEIYIQFGNVFNGINHLSDKLQYTKLGVPFHRIDRTSIDGIIPFEKHM